MYRTPAYQELTRPLAEVLGAKTATEFEALRVYTVGDLVRHLPRRYFGGTESSNLGELQIGEEAAVVAFVGRTSVAWGAHPRLTGTITDGRAVLPVVFFGRQHNITWWQQVLQEGRRGIFAGKVTSFDGRPQLTNPDFVVLGPEGEILAGAQKNLAMASTARAGMISVYPATRKLKTWAIAESVALVLDLLAEVPDPLPAAIRDAAGVVDFQTALRGVHRPSRREDVAAGQRRLRFDEAFAVQAAMAYRRVSSASQPATPRPRRTDGMMAAFDARLPFTLTEGQERVSEEIFADLAQSHPMHRLLQGEVGSGKTLVSLRAMLAVVDTGGQAALLAPTEVLAAQHYRTIVDQLGDLAGAGTLDAATDATRVTLLSGSMGAVRKKKALLEIASGEAGIVIGTHALLADRVQFADLGLVVVDEQHRFGVEQRAALAAKADTRPHLLAMTATPIPRTVAMTIFGDLNVSTLAQVPAGRSEVTTTVVPEDNPAWLRRVWERVAEEVAAGRQAFIVCSRIAEKDTSAEALAGTEETAGIVPHTVEDLYAELAAGPLAGISMEKLHGQLSAEDKDATMARFAAGETAVLVATTVIEVGVNVPNASVMVICDAERFGISQLHQLRGRIGRGSHPGVCMLLTQLPAEARDSPAAHRLVAVAATRDGFALADADLEQRREGDVLGATQSGRRSSLRLLRVLDHTELIETARDAATAWAERDPDRTDPGIADIVAQIEDQAAADWLDRV
ncbi:ATP-dependent DNA helicase RecG [Granulicoccus phenolivorans]|uniref:ATP-dependent DNA helicase RecG n=1 Tax=Granulicoccus phenolivorans TaxID=266854 RepID=UPI00041D8E71|nr:ATP-dependent DNA helicase RecG [Granulicoccus phenolivorans]